MSKVARKGTRNAAPKWRFPRVLDIEWVDSVMSSGWSDADNYGPKFASRCRSVGFLIRETSESVQLGLSQDPDCDNLNGAITIPKVAITKRRRLR